MSQLEEKIKQTKSHNCQPTSTEKTAANVLRRSETFGFYYIGNCTNSFDPDTGKCYLPYFEDTSDFAVKDENAQEISKAEFSMFVPEVPDEIKEALKATDEHKLKFLFYDNNIFVIYDGLNDIHYFFGK